MILASNPATQAQQPDNAATLYRQALRLYERPDSNTNRAVTQFRNGEIGTNNGIIRYIEQNRPVIDILVKAADITECDWGDDPATANATGLRQLSGLLAAEAGRLADQGDPKAAFDQCTTLHKMAIHACGETLVNYLVGLAIEGVANTATVQVLGLVRPDAETLTQLKSDLVQTNERFPSLSTNLKREVQATAAKMTRESTLATLRQAREAGVSIADDSVTTRLGQGDEAFYNRNREFYLSMMETVTSLLEANTPYAQTCESIDSLGERLGKQMRNNPDATLASLALSPTSVRRPYQLAVRRQTNVNALQAAIDVYIALAQTGRLPEALPATCPPDLFSGKPFIYTKTPDGFTLHCQSRESADREPEEYEFKISQ